MTRGGHRPGAGRPRKENKRVKINLVVGPETAAWIKRQAKEESIGQGRIIDKIAEKERGTF